MRSKLTWSLGSNAWYDSSTHSSSSTHSPSSTHSSFGYDMDLADDGVLTGEFCGNVRKSPSISAEFENEIVQQTGPDFNFASFQSPGEPYHNFSYFPIPPNADSMISPNDSVM